MGKKVFLTGAGGFAGSHALEHILVNTDWNVVCTDSFRHKGKTDRIAGVLDAHPGARDRVSVVTHDLAAPLSDQMVHRVGDVDYIIAYASESHVDRSIVDPVPFITNNTAVILHTLEFARRIRVDAVVVVSTDEVYGPEVDGVPFKEWAPIVPSNPYSASKAAQEAIAISYWRTYDVPVMLINCMNMIGERQDVEKFVPLVIKACQDDREVTIHGSATDVGSRHYLHARNLADGILYLLGLRTPAPYHSYVPAFDVRSGDRPDRYNVASADRIDNLSLACMIASHMGVQLKYRFEDFPGQRPGHDAHYGLDPSLINSLGWVPPVDFASSLKKTVDWYLANPEWLR